jgi:hypothetical protein
MAAHKCLAGCGKTITWQFAICSECEMVYGSSPYQWPGWLRYLWRQTQKERRQTKKQNSYEINLDITDLEGVITNVR